ncbi:hypothetical protein [Leifsonia poae]|uniref:hypothetical protein n=1 Tax=Leifsonia poae TaxID=110933 RepID=UPI001CBE1A47|nr:hypothetical protein [Leifsonia poae]
MHEIAHHLIVHAIDNPLNGVLPDFSVFGVQFDALWKKLIAGIWGICIIISIAFLAIGLTGMAGSSEGAATQWPTSRHAPRQSGPVSRWPASLRWP